MQQQEISEMEEELDELSYQYKRAFENCYKEVLNSLKSADKNYPDSGDLYSLLDNPSSEQIGFSKAAIAMVEIDLLDVWNPDTDNSDYKFDMLEMDKKYLQKSEDKAERLCERI